MSNLIGQTLGRYHILEQLGEGGMATVYKAYDTRLETDVAVKVIRTDNILPSTLERTLKRFEREAKALARLTHPNIVKVTDYGEHEGKPYLVMVYLPGGTLKQKLGKPVSWREAARLLLPIARALDFAHRQNMIHRDVKPSNILITADGEPMLTDFGIAKILDLEETQDLTGTGMGIGTPEYMAPEQWTGKTSPQSDQYALGVVLYEMLTGRKPYSADTPAAILLKQATEPLQRPSAFARDLPDKVEKLLLKALAKNPEDRYANMGEFAIALESALGGTSAPAKPQPARPREQREDTKATMVQEGTILKESSAPARPIPSPTGSPSRALREEAKGGVLSLSKHDDRNHLRYWPLALIGLVCLFGLIFILVYGDRLTTTLFPTPTITYTSTPTRPPTSTPTKPLTPTVTFTSTPGIGSTWTRPADGMVMMFVPAGFFRMGSQDNDFDEHPIHTVNLDAYWMDRTEVTNKMYAICEEAGICTHPQGVNSATRKNYYADKQYADFPVVNVDWNQVNTYCQWAEARLPTEAEWEKAARGMDGRVYPWGDTLPTCSLANFDPHTSNQCIGNTSKVGSYESGKSPYGIYDLAGNVWEWVADWFEPDYYSISPTNNPMGPSSGGYRALRGGSWYSGDLSGNVRSSLRGGSVPVNSNFDLGFRCSRSP